MAIYSLIALLIASCTPATTPQNQITSITLDQQTDQLLLGQTDSLIAAIQQRSLIIHEII